MNSNQTIVHELRHKRGNPRNSEGTFITLQSGRILFVYTRYTGTSWSDNGRAYLASIFSDDGGLTWSQRTRTVIANEGQCNVMSPSLLRLHDGRIALFYCRTNTFHDCRTYMRISTDECASWSEPTLCIPAPGYFVVNNDRVIQLKSGRIILPAAYHRPTKDYDPSAWDSWDYRAITLFYYSDDNGNTWHESEDWWALPRRTRSGMQEPGVLEMLDGTLYAWSRTDTGRQWHMRSRNLGGRWSRPQPAPFHSPNSALSIKRDPATRHLIAIWNDKVPRWGLPKPVVNQGYTSNSSWGRTPLVMAISQDDGVNWKNFQLLEQDHRFGYCYPAIHFVGSYMLIGYCFGGLGDGVLQNTRIRKIQLNI